MSTYEAAPGQRHGLGEVEHELAELTTSQDYTTGVVPLTKRNSLLTMTLLWVSLQGSVSIMYAGYLARSQGLSLGNVIWAGVIAVVALYCYGLGSSNLGAFTGQTHTLLTRSVFGRVGSGLVSVLLIIMGMGWYGFQALFLAQILQGLFGWKDVTAVATAFGVVMIFNNLFGFRGVSGYARYLAAPILLLWSIYAIIKGLATVPSGTLFSSVHVSQTTSIMLLVGLLVGSGMWGNEPDIFRYSQPRRWFSTPALLIGYVVGMLIFTIAGYLMAELSKTTDFGAIFKYFVDFTLFGFTALATIVFFINQFALNDGNLYEAINAMQNIFGSWASWRRLFSVLILGAAGAIVAWFMASQSTLQNNFFIVANISAIFVPCATMIMVMDVFIVPRLFGLRRPIDKVTMWHNAAPINWVGVAALVIGLIVGAVTGGLIPGTAGFGTTNIGFPALQAWVVACVCYLAGVALVQRSAERTTLLGYPSHGPAAEAPDTAKVLRPS